MFTTGMSVLSTHGGYEFQTITFNSRELLSYLQKPSPYCYEEVGSKVSTCRSRWSARRGGYHDIEPLPTATNNGFSFRLI